jgi:predicted phosphodiesterase
MDQQFDYLSDLHINSWLSSGDRRKPSQLTRLVQRKYLRGLLESGVPLSNTLVVAGDFGHSNDDTVALVSTLLQQEFYKDVVFVPGNHDMASRMDGDNFPSYQDRLADLAAKVAPISGAHMLLGNSVTIRGVTYGGTVGWYDYSFSIQRLGHTLDQGRAIFPRWWDWNNVLMPGRQRIADFMDVFKEEYAKMEALTPVVDVMVTHMGPVHDCVPGKFAEDPYSGFFYFDGSKLIDPATKAPKVWVFGHTHTGFDRMYGNTRLVCNPYGYRGENPGVVFGAKTVKLVGG